MLNKALFSLCVSTFIIGCQAGNGKENPDVDDNKKPVAVITSASTNVLVGEQATFNGVGSFDPDGNVVSYSWEVDNQPVGLGAELKYNFNSLATYQVKLTVEDNKGASHSDVRSITVDARPNIVVSQQNTSIEIGQQVVIDASGSTDNGTINSYQWVVANQVISTLPKLEYTPQNIGTIAIELIVTDEKNIEARKVFDVNISALNNNNPIIKLTVSETAVKVKESVYFDASGSTDVEDGSNLMFKWLVDGVAVTVDTTGKLPSSFSTFFSSVGEHTVTVVVTDQSGGRSEQTQKIIVSELQNAEPVVSMRVVNNLPYLAGESISFKATASDKESDPLTYSWFVDNQEQAGQVSDAFTTTLNKGTYEVKVVVNDSVNSVSAIQNITIQEASSNNKPVAVLTAPSSVILGQSVTFDASNSYDPDNGDSVSFKWYVDGVLSSVEFNSKMNIIFPDVGSHTISVVVTDQFNATDTQQVTIDVGSVSNGIPPVAVINLPVSSGVVPLKVSFDANLSTDDDGNNTIDSYSWRVDGQQISTAAEYEYEFTAVGDYTLSLIVTDNTGLSSQVATKTVNVNAADSNLPEKFTLLEDTGKMKIYEINNCGVNPELIPNSGFIHVNASGTSANQSWNHVPNQANRFSGLTSGNYGMSTSMNAIATDCSSVPTQHNVFVKRYSDWHNQHANGIDYSMTGIKFGDIASFVVDLYIRSDRTEFLTPSQLLDTYGPDSNIVFPLTAQEVTHMDIGHLNLGFEIAKGDGPGSKVALANLSIDPKYMDRWIRVEMKYEDMWLFEKDHNYIPQDRTEAQLANESPEEIKLVAETLSTDVYRNYRQDELHQRFNIQSGSDLPNSVPKNYKVIDLEIKRMELIVKP